MNEKLSANDVIISLLINNSNPVKIREIADNLLKSQKNPASNFSIRLRGLINNYLPKTLRELEELPHQLKKLVLLNGNPPDYVFLSEPLELLISDLVLEWEHSKVFKEHNLKMRRKILLHGETGNGKTTIAKKIAVLTGLPFIEINSDSVLDSHLGSTGKNVNSIFNEIKMPCVVFWDEIDSIAKKRGGDKANSAGGHEGDRIVNSMLVNIDRLNEDVIFIAATNREDILDDAFKRRIDLHVEVTPPNESEKIRFATELSDRYKLSPPNIDSIRDLRSYADITNYYVSEARSYVMSKIKSQKHARSIA